MEPLESRRVMATFTIDVLSGSDSNPGTADAPFRTISRGIAVAGQSAGADTLEIRPGTYNESLSISDTSGTLTLRGLPSATAGVSVRSTGSIVTIRGGHSVRLENLNLSNATNGVTVYSGVPLVELDNVAVVNNSGNGVVVSSASTIAITGGVYRGNFHGVYLDGGATLRVENAGLNSNRGAGVYGVNLQDVTVIGGTFDANTREGMFLANVRDVSISGATAQNNQDNGFDIRTARDVTLANATVRSNASLSSSSGVDGVYLNGANSVVVTGGEYSSNSYNGLGLNSVTTSIAITGATATSNAAAGFSASGQASVSIADSTASGNTMRGMHVVNSQGTTIRNVLAADNGSTSVTDNLGGGGIRVANSNLFPVLLDNVTVRGNRSLREGGGISIGTAGAAIVQNSLVENNSNRFGQANGGGIAFPPTSGTYQVVDTTIRQNEALNGGGIYARINLSLERSTIENNYAVTNGGGVAASSGTLYVIQSTISGNTAGSLEQYTAGEGGGIWAGAVAGKIENSTISGNTAGLRGGGIRAGLGSSRLDIAQTTITENTSSNGGGLHVASGSPYVFASILAGNSATIGPDLSGPISSLLANLVGIGTGGSGYVTAGTTMGDQVGTDAAPISPLLGELRPNGGPTKTHALLRGSPAVDYFVGDDSGVDQRGQPRWEYFDGDGDGVARRDIGAFEVKQFNLPPAIAVEQTSLAVTELDTASNQGTFRDPDENQIVAVTASIGEITLAPDESLHFGNWAWSLPNPDSASLPYHVIVTATDESGKTAQVSFTLTVANSPPTATLSNSGPVAEGGAATVSFSNATDPSAEDVAAGFTYSFDFDDDGTFDASGPSATAQVPAALLADGPGTRVVRGRITDKDGGATTYVTTITVSNVAPTATLSNSGPVAEGGTAAVSFTNAMDPSAADVAAGFTYSFDFDDDGTFDASGPSATAPVPAALLANGPGTRVVRGRITDKDGGSTTYVTTLTVSNVAPVLAPLTSNASVAGAVAQGAAVTLGGTFTDVGVLDTHTATVDWGDGSGVQTLSVSESAGAGSIAGSHVYAAGGDYTILATLTDVDGASEQRSLTVTVAGLRLADRILYVFGRSVADVISISQKSSVITVNTGFLAASTVTANQVDKFMVQLLGGDDQLTISSNVSKPVVALGGEGNDTMSSGGAASLLIGGTGQDTLISGKAADVLIGGDVTNVEADLWSALAAWMSTDSYAKRANSVRSLLTIIDDLALDQLSGKNNVDLMIRGVGDR